MSPQFPVIVDRLLEVLPNLDGWGEVTVFDGPPTANDDITSFYCTVGYDELATGGETAGNWQTALAGDGYSRRETGEVRGRLNRQGSRDDMRGARLDLITAWDAVEQFVKDDRRLGVLSPDSTLDLQSDLVQVQTNIGPFASISWAFVYATTRA